MKKIYFFIILSILFITGIQKGYSQLDSLEKSCASLIKYPFISDGQDYRALVLNGETAEFYYTFYGGAVYRIVACSSINGKPPVFRIYDSNRKLLFSSEYYNNPKYWDFKFTSTIEGIIEAELPPTDAPSGIIILLIGFK